MLSFQNPELKISADFTIKTFQHPEFNIFADFKT